MVNSNELCRIIFSVSLNYKYVFLLFQRIFSVKPMKGIIRSNKEVIIVKAQPTKVRKYSNYLALGMNQNEDYTHVRNFPFCTQYTCSEHKTSAHKRSIPILYYSQYLWCVQLKLQNCYYLIMENCTLSRHVLVPSVDRYTGSRTSQECHLISNGQFQASMLRFWALSLPLAVFFQMSFR